MPGPASAYPPTRRAAALRVWMGLVWAFGPLAPELLAQPATNSGAINQPLPLRNLLVEMRQVQTAQASTQSLDADSGLRTNQSQSSTTAQQQVLVLNGRSSTVALRTSVPWRMMTMAFRNGCPVRVPGVIVVQATTGFQVLPRWDGTDNVELDLAASQGGAAAASTVLVPVGEWTVVAESDQSQATQRHDLLGAGRAESDLRYTLEVRVLPR